MYHEYSRSLSEGDFHDHISCLPKFSNIFNFVHANYAGWTVKYHNSLLTYEETHPETLKISGYVSYQQKNRTFFRKFHRFDTGTNDQF